MAYQSQPTGLSPEVEQKLHMQFAKDARHNAGAYYIAASGAILHDTNPRKLFEKYCAALSPQDVERICAQIKGPKKRAA